MGTLNKVLISSSFVNPYEAHAIIYITGCIAAPILNPLYVTLVYLDPLSGHPFDYRMNTR